MKLNKDIAIVTVVYAPNAELKSLITMSYKSMPKGYYRIAVVNNNNASINLGKHNHEVIINNENCLAKAWNIGIKQAIELGYKYILLPNLDVELAPDLIDTLYDKAQSMKGQKIGIWGADSFGYNTDTTIPSNHGDGTFSCFLLDVEAFKDIGDFDEDFKPAYFEDCDYLERAWAKGYKPVKVLNATYFHFTQGTVKNDINLQVKYPEFMQRNLELFIKKYNKVPEHLPKDIKFK